MGMIPFSKHSLFGNSFVIVDETYGPLLSEEEKQSFAYQATNECFGIGSDNFLVIQPCIPEVLEGINRRRRYWDKIPDVSRSDFIFRMFEPNGMEAFSCGNGLMCVANLLYRRYGIKSARIMTEIPSRTPVIVRIGVEQSSGRSWANMGRPRRVPSEMASPSMVEHYDNEIDLVRQINIADYRESDGISFFSKETTLSITGYLVFTGEPHLVVFTETGLSLKETACMIFPSSLSSKRNFKTEKRINAGSKLIDFIGKYFERACGEIFPIGINIDFVRLDKQNGALEYRCFERGINRETLACGTGALAAAFVAHRLNIIDSSPVKVLPHRCRWYVQDAEIEVQESMDGWHLYGWPAMLFEGGFCFDYPDSACRSLPSGLLCASIRK
jgi:diaminopimelate epimerase